MTNEEKERATNRLLYLLSQHPADGLTARELAEQSGGLNKDQVGSVLENSHAHKSPGAGKGGPINNPAHVWKLRGYVPGSENDEDLKRRVSLGSKG